MSKIYFISGLGADRRAFDRIEEFNGYQKVFIDWKSNHKKESIKSYSKRLFENFTIAPDDNIISLSFGGLIAQEIALSHKISKIILISSFRDARDLKAILRYALTLRLHYLIPNFRISLMSTVIRNWFNVSSSSGTEILNQMVNSTNIRLMKWSMEKIRASHFELNRSIIMYNIIGDKDRILRLWKNENTSIVTSGGHFMVYENANEVNKILKQLIIPSSQQ